MGFIGEYIYYRDQSKSIYDDSSEMIDVLIERIDKSSVVRMDFYRDGTLLLRKNGRYRFPTAEELNELCSIMECSKQAVIKMFIAECRIKTYKMYMEGEDDDMPY